jgi:small subunit ribosomal protein S6
MRRYETIFIANPDLTEEARVSLFDRMESIITERNGLQVETDVWGTKRLAYAIKKKERGHYVRFDYCGSGEIVNELERTARIDDRILKYMTVLLDEAPDLDQIREAIAQKQRDQNAAEEAAKSIEEPPVNESDIIIKDTEPSAEKTDADQSENEITETKES